MKTYYSSPANVVEVNAKAIKLTKVLFAKYQTIDSLIDALNLEARNPKEKAKSYIEYQNLLAERQSKVAKELKLPVNAKFESFSTPTTKYLACIKNYAVTMFYTNGNYHVGILDADLPSVERADAEGLVICGDFKDALEQFLIYAWADQSAKTIKASRKALDFEPLPYEPPFAK